MTNLKSILLGTGAAIVAATATAQAADLPIVEPVDYVQICDLYGNGYFYLPGTNTCLKIGGFARFQAEIFDDNGPARLNGAVFGNLPNRTVLINPVTGVPVVIDNDDDDFAFLVRGRLNFDARTETDLGTLRSFIQIEAGNTVLDDNPVDLDLAYVQFNVGPAVMTAGLAPSVAGVKGPSTLEDSAFGSGGGDSIQLGFAFDVGPFQAGLAIVDPRNVIRGSDGGGIGGFVTPAFGFAPNQAGLVNVSTQNVFLGNLNDGDLGNELPYLEAEANFSLAGITIETGAAIGEVRSRFRAFDNTGTLITREFDEIGYALAASANAEIAGFKIGAGASYAHGLTDYGTNDANPFRRDARLGVPLGRVATASAAANVGLLDFELIDSYSVYGQIGADIGIFEVNLIGTYGEIEFPTFATTGGIANGGDTAEAYTVHLNAAIAPVEGLTIAAEVFYADLEVDRNLVVAQAAFGGIPRNTDGSVDNDSFGAIFRIQRNF